MSKSARLQIPIEPEDAALLRDVAARHGKPLAEWARSHLIALEREDELTEVRDRRELLNGLSGLFVDLGSIDELNAELDTGRYR